jgi:tetratricopeptide (TPR) repeat protein
MLTQDVADLGPSRQILEEIAVLAIRDANPQRCWWLKQWCDVWESLFKRSGSIVDLVHWFRALKTSVTNTVRSDSTWSDLVQAVGRACEARYNLTKNPQDLEKWFKAAHDAAHSVPDGHPLRPALMGRVSAAAALKYRATMNPSDLDAFSEAAEESRRIVTSAVPELSSDQPESEKRQKLQEIMGRSLALVAKAEASDDPRDWEECLLVLKETFELCEDHQKPMLKADYINCLSRQGQQFGDQDVLTRAVLLAEDALRVTPEDSLYRHRLFSALSTALEQRYNQGRQDCDLRAAVSAAQEAVKVSPRDSTSRAENLVRLLTILTKEREALGGDRKTLDAILSQLDLEVAKGSLSPAALTQYANHLNERYVETRNPDYQEAAYLAIRQVVNSKDAEIMTPFVAEVIAQVHDHRHERKQDRFDMEECIKYTNILLELCGKDLRRASRHYVRLVNYLLARFARFHDEGDLDAAVSVIDRAYQMPGEQDDVANILLARAEAYQRRYEVKRSRSDADCALDCLAKIPRDSPTHGIEATYQAAMMRLRDIRRPETIEDVVDTKNQLKRIADSMLPVLRSGLCSSYTLISRTRIILAIYDALEEWDEASDISQLALEQLQALCGRHFLQQDQQAIMSHTGDFASMASSVSLRTGNVARALQQLELGRGLILRYMIESRTALGHLHDVDPELAAEYKSLQVKLRNLPTGTTPGAQQHLRRYRTDLTDKLQRCTQQISKVPGYEWFLTGSEEVEQLQEEAREGPIVWVNMTSHGKDAIIVTPRILVPIALPPWDKKIPEFLEARLKRDRSITEDLNNSHPRDIECEIAVERGDDFLEWLWVYCVKPVLDKLRTDRLVSFDPLPRIWWIGTGLASGFPFHAAGSYEDRNSDDNTLSHCIPSYITGIKSLRHARNSATQVERGIQNEASLLLVTMPTTPGQNALPGVSREATAVQGVFQRTEREGHSWTCEILEQPSSRAVLQRLNTYNIVHFACHGTSDHTNPSNSHLLLLDHSSKEPKVDALTMSDVSRTVTEGKAWIAYLSACSTAEIKDKTLVDEALHLVSAFQVAGFPHVVGSLWTVDDHVCISAARMFYESLTQQDRFTNPNRAVPAALRDTILQLRREYWGQPSQWATFIHVGA